MARWDRSVSAAAWRPRSPAPTVLALGGLILTVGLSFAVVRAGWSGTTAFILAALVATVVALAVGNLERLLLGVVLIDIPLRWDRNFAYDFDAAALGAVGGLTVSATTLALGGLYVLWAVDEYRSNPGSVRIRPALPLVAYTVAIALSVATAADRNLGAFQLALLIQTLLVFVYVSNAVRTRKDVIFLVAVLVVGFLVEAVLVLGVALADLQFDVAGLATRSNELVGDAPISRAGGTIGSANGAAAYVAMMIPVALSVFWADVPLWLKRVSFVALSVGGVALILTYSRGGWAAALAGIAAVLLIGSRRRITTGIAACMVVACVVLVLLPFKSEIGSRVLGETQGVPYAENARIPLIRLSWQMIEDRPLLGVGANNFGTSIERYAGPEFTGEWLRSVHNTFLLVWAEAGMLALAALLWFILSSLRRGWSVVQEPDRLRAPLALGLLGAVVAATITMGVERFIGRPLVQLLVVAAATLVALDLLDDPKSLRQDVSKPGVPKYYPQA